MLGGFAILFLSLFQDRLLPAPLVKTATVLATAGTASSTEKPGAGPADDALPMLFQASGWVEPDPFPVKATALIDGVVASVQVLEGQPVQKGEVIATLVDDDARLKRAAAEGRHRMLVAARASHRASITAAGSRRDAAKAEVAAAETLQAEAVDQVNRVESLRGGAVSESDVTIARLRLQREQANLLAAQSKLAEQIAEIARLEAETKTKDEEIALALVAVDQEKLALERTRILSPITGRVLRLLAAPGEKKMLAMDHPDSSTVAMVYEPSRLQVRVDVPLADAAGLRVGQKTKVHCSLLPEQIFEGEVTRITGEADLQRNTLQAKVRILHPSDLLRPEMLCRVEFLSIATGPGSPSPRDTGALALWIPNDALRENQVWVCDPDTRRVSRRPVQPATEQREGYVRIKEGLLPGEQVVLSPGNLREDQRVNPLLIQP